jgi:DNA modification methylase
MQNTLYHGDCLEILKGLPSESVDLIYLDPPFFSNRNYEVIWGDAGETQL